MFALIGGKVLTMRGEPIDNAKVLIKDGKILAVGRNIEVPDGFHTIDVTGKIVTPGIIDAHTHLGVYGEAMAWAGEDANEKSEPVTPGMHTLDAINPADIGLAEAYHGGITTVMIAPGSANPIGGQCVIAKTKKKTTADDMIIRKHAGLKIAFGENPRRCFGAEQKKAPITRMATANIIRETFYKAEQYMKKQGKKDFQFNLGLEAVVRVLRKEMPLRAHAHRADDIVTAIRIAKEFGVDIIIEHATESYLVADVLAREDVPAILGPTLTTRSKLELKDKSMAAPAILHQQGVRFAMMSDHPVIPSCFLPVYAGLATRYGLPEEQGLKMITSEAAKILGLGNQLGSIAPGLDADLVVWSGHPFHLASRPELVIVDGVAEQANN
ncbi:amidohydrolase [Anaerosporomusa subterranea]|uniref:Amidohydrolase n=1 Tax=Anaerosporomusa subterranea TaxID=1794912 RepID=A0A154BVT6_ANASB|nr:amidohydrolase [Anaerosporomusa subterranea]KYZ78052.1 amidohydrolase [Anaerosporomusa subterranea]